MNFHPSTFNLMLSEAESCAHAAGVNVRYSCATNAGSDANLFHYPVTLGSLADLSSDSEVEIIEAIGMQISSSHSFICTLVLRTVRCENALCAMRTHCVQLPDLVCTIVKEICFLCLRCDAVLQKSLSYPRSGEAGRTLMLGSWGSSRRFSGEHSIRTFLPEKRLL